MIKIFHIALREFMATAATKAFVIGITLPILIMALAVKILPALMNKDAPRISGRIAIIDHSGVIAPRIAAAMDAARVKAEQTQAGTESTGKVDDLTGDKTGETPSSQPSPLAPREKQDSAADLAGKLAAQANPGMQVQPAEYQITLDVLAEDTDIEAAKSEIRKAENNASKAGGADDRLALAIVPRGAVEAAQGGTFSDFELFTAPKLDVEIQKVIQRQLGAAIVDARLERRGLDPLEVRALTDRPEGIVKTVTESGDKSMNDAAKMLVPAAFMFLLWISTLTCGNYLLTSTIEEKSSRVMEVILSAVSPMQLLTGKILGQMVVGVVILVVYCGLGMAGLVLASMMSLLPLVNLIYLLIYFFIAFFLIASLMAAIGSAVSDVKEAQSLLGPIMVLLMVPLMLWLPILRNPNSMFAQVCSFVPFISPFVMILRLSGSEAVAFWQIPASIGFGILTIIISMWVAAKIFRIGVLMYGKPPDLRTLIKWIRMA